MNQNMQQMKESRSKRKRVSTKNRRRNFDEEENINFVIILSKYKDILASQDGKRNAKNCAWRNIMEEFNCTSKIERPVNCLRDKYSNLYMQVKKLVSNPYTAFINSDKHLVFSCELPDYVWQFANLYYEMFPSRVEDWMKEGNSGDIHVEYLDDDFATEVRLDESQGSSNMEINYLEQDDSINSFDLANDSSEESFSLNHIDESWEQNTVKRIKIESEISPSIKAEPEKERGQEIKGTVHEKEDTVQEKDETVQEKDEIVQKKDETVQKKENVQEKEDIVQEKEVTAQENKETSQGKEETAQEKEDVSQEKEETSQEKEDLGLEEIQKLVWKEKAKLLRLQIIEQRREMKRNREYHAARMESLDSQNEKNINNGPKLTCTISTERML